MKVDSDWLRTRKRVASSSSRKEFEPELKQAEIFVRAVVETLNRRTYQKQKCLDEEKEEKVLEKEALSVTEKSYVITSKVSPSQLFVVLPVEVV